MKIRSFISICVMTIATGTPILAYGGVGDSDPATEIGAGSVFTVKKAIPVPGKARQVVYSNGVLGSIDWFGISTCVLQLSDVNVHSEDSSVPVGASLRVKTKPDFVTDGSGYNKMRIKYEFEPNPYFKNMDCEGGLLTRLQVNQLTIRNVKNQLGEMIAVDPAGSTAASFNSADSAKSTASGGKILNEVSDTLKQVQDPLGATPK